MPAAVMAAGQEGQGAQHPTTQIMRGKHNAHWPAVLNATFQRTDHHLDTVTDTSSSVPTSQSSSLNASQPPQTQSSSDTSHSNPSNQSSQQDDLPHALFSQTREHTAIPVPPRDLRLTTSLPEQHDSKVNGSHAISRNHGDETSHGQKRTASGHVKTPSSSLPTSPEDGVTLGHSRQTSTASATSQIGSVGTAIEL